MRGGFRMPKGQLSPEISAMMEPNFAKRQQRENEDVISGWEADEAKGPPLPALGATGGSKDASRRPRARARARDARARAPPGGRARLKTRP